MDNIQKPPTKLLIIDDDKYFCLLFQLFSRNYNCEWVSCSTGEEAIEKLQDKNFEPEYCFLDYKLIPYSAEETMKKIKRLRPYLKIVILSGFLSSLAIENITQVGYAMFLKKPDNFKDSFFEWLFSWLKIDKKTQN